MFRLLTAAILIGCLSVSWGKDHKLVYDQDVDVYTLKWSGNRISEAEMRRIAVLSPFVDYAPQFSIGSATVKSPAGKIVTDKVILAPELELCVGRPGQPCNRNPEKLDALFLENAAHNLRDAQNQLETLRAQKLPQALEPVRSFLLEHLQLSLEQEESRFEYLKAGNIAPLRDLLCRACSCTARDEALLQGLQSESDPSKRLKLSRVDWHNRVLECQKQRRPATYPIEAWERFVREFGIAEVRTPKHIE